MFWRVLFLLVAMLSTPANADRTLASYEAALVALDDCRTAWFQSSREDALERAEKAARALVLALNPLSSSFDVDAKRSQEATDAYAECGRIVIKNR